MDTNFPVLEIADRLVAIERLDHVSSRQLPVRLSTLVRRTARALPGPMQEALDGFCATAPLDPAATLPHARALATLLEVVADFDTRGSLPAWLGELRDAAHELLRSAGCSPPADDESMDELIIALVDDALFRNRVALERADLGEYYDVFLEFLDRRWVTLAQEGLATRDAMAALAAARLASGTASSHVSLSLFYSELAMAWCPPDDPDACIRARLVEAAVAAGDYARAIEVGESFLALLEAPLDDAWWVLTGCRAFINALLERGEDTRAVETAGLMAWCAEQTFGPDGALTIDTYGDLARTLGRTGAPDRAAALLEHLLAKQRPRVDNIAREFAHTGLLLATTYEELGRYDDAARTGSEMLRLCESRLGPGDGLTTSLREFLHELDDE